MDVGVMAGGFAGSRSQENAARGAYAKWIQLGGQPELDRLTAAVNSDPELNAAWRAMIIAGNSGDWFSAIGDTIVSAVPMALVATAGYFLAPMVMEAISGTVATGGAATVSSAAEIAAATSGTVATGGAATVSSAAEIAAATGMNMEAAAIYSASGFSAAELGAAAALDAAAAAGSVISNISTAQSIYDPIAAMTGGGVGVTDAAVLDAAMAAPGATAGMAGNIAAASADLYGTAAASGFSTADTFSIMQKIQQGVKVDSIFSGITGTVTDLAGAAVSTYGAIQGVQLQKAQIDLANQQAKNAALAAANPPMYMTAAGGVNWSMIGLGVAALLGVFLVLKKA